MLLTIMSSLAQEESRSISENVTWGVRKRFSDGKVSVPYRSFLGYEKGPDGNLAVNEEEAKIIRFIYGASLMGKSPFTIAKELTRKGIPTPRGKREWGQTTIISILSNEKYTGNAILQKTYTPDFLTKKRKVNHGEIPKYYVEHSHEGIISQEQFDLVQQRLKQPSGKKTRHYSTGIFSGMVKCGDCGSFYGSKVWHSNDKYRTTIWQCNQKFRAEKKCRTPHLREEELIQVYLKAVNKLFENRDAVISRLEKMLLKNSDTSEVEKEQRSLERELVVLSEMMQKSLSAPIFSAGGNDANDYDELADRYQEIGQRLQEISLAVERKKQQTTAIKRFCKFMKETGEVITEFDIEQFFILVDHMTVYGKGDVRLTFRDGAEL